VPFFPAIWITVLGVACAVAGVWLSSIGHLSRKLVPFGGGTLLGVGLFWVLPEIAESLHWPQASLWLAGGCVLLMSVDRYVYPVCPTCSPGHDHAHCATRLHGFATPLLAASAIHAAMDGWSAAASQQEHTLGLGVLLGIAAHKVPEGLALGVIVRAALRTRGAAMLWCALAQSAALLGAGAEAFVAPLLGARAMHALLALAGGSFLYLGWHAVHSEFRRSGASPALVPALTGVAGSSVLRLLLR
jgi:zinc transporter ZupT